jgi:hypothetical protein
MKRSVTFWAIVLIVVGVLLLLSALGIIPGGSGYPRGRGGQHPAWRRDASPGRHPSRRGESDHFAGRSRRPAGQRKLQRRPGLPDGAGLRPA